jgi:hypothetical protein
MLRPISQRPRNANVHLAEDQKEEIKHHEERKGRFREFRHLLKRNMKEKR